MDAADHGATSMDADTGKQSICFPEYSHQSVMDSVDKMNRELEELRVRLMKDSLRCHILAADLASQYSPYMVDAIRNVTQDCKKCSSSIRHICGLDQHDDISGCEEVK
ncbi:hypothetical protein ACJMK2_005142 [Sinanodonta woodiana]|uniref:Uncharacterized protein n=1 Tax=Sinanodonta woodiana TaxID=1069815 RepID=A0ABD3VPT2_SINWO